MIFKGNDDVVMCTASSNTGSVLRYFNNGHKSSVQSDSGVGLTNIVVTNSNGVLRCQFNRVKANASVSNYFSLYNTYYVLLAKGVLSGNIIKKIRKCSFIIFLYRL